MRKREIACLVKAAVIAFTPYIAFKTFVITQDAKARAAWEDIKARDEHCRSKAATLRAAAEAVKYEPDTSR